MQCGARVLPQLLMSANRKIDRPRAKLVLRERYEYVAQRKPVAPDVVDHRVIGIRGGIHFLDLAVNAKMPREIERDLHARRILRFCFVMRELEEIRLPSALDHEAGRGQPIADIEREHFELSARRERFRRLADES